MASSFVMKRLLVSNLVSRSAIFPLYPAVTRASRFINTNGGVTVGDCDFTEDNRIAFDLCLDVTMHIEGEVHEYDGFNCVSNFSLSEDIKTSDYTAQMKNGVLRVIRQKQGKEVNDGNVNGGMAKKRQGKAKQGMAKQGQGKGKEVKFTTKDFELFPSRRMKKFDSKF